MPAEKMNISAKEEILKKVSLDTDLPLAIVEKVISWSYMKANNAVKENGEVEMSGLGKFLVSQAKVRRRIASIEESISNPGIAPEKVIELNKELEYVKTKKK